MKMFKVYAHLQNGCRIGRTFQLVLARNPKEAAEIAVTVWREGGQPQSLVSVARLTMPEGKVGLIYEGVQTMRRFTVEGDTVSETAN